MKNLILTLTLALIIPGCLESNPQPSPHGPDSGNRNLVDTYKGNEQSDEDIGNPDRNGDVRAPDGDTFPVGLQDVEVSGEGLGDISGDLDVESELTDAVACSPEGLVDICCCDMDALTEPVCVDGAWTCPQGFSLFSGDDCSWECGSPCSMPCPDLKDVEEELGQPDLMPDPDADNVRLTSLSFLLNISGGFMATNRNYMLEGELLTRQNLISAPGEICSGQVGQDLLLPILDQAAQVPWAELLPTYISPENPNCCCDQFIMNLQVTVHYSDATSVAASTSWCDESLAQGLVPQALVVLIEQIKDAATAIGLTCQPVE